MQSNCCVAYNWFKNVANASPTVDLGVTNTTAATSSRQHPFYAAHNMPNNLYCCIMSSCNAINRITTIVVLPCSAYASNINNKLFLLPVSIIATIGLSPATIVLIASCCTL
jgi:hypothetical protein